MKKIILIVFMFICIVGIIFSGYKIIEWKLSIDSNRNIKKETEKYTKKIDNKDEINFKELKKKYPNVVAYLKVNGTNIDHPVVQASDNDYYLTHNLKKEKNVAGWIFADYHNKFDGTDKNIVVYGHNMRDGSMFSTLKNVLTKDWQEVNNRKVLFVTDGGANYYEVFSTYSVEPELYYIQTGFKSDDEYASFLKKIVSRSVYDYKTSVNINDKILTLSSCVENGTKRVVLHAKLINNEKN